VGQIFLASEETEEWSAQFSTVVADSSAQHRVAGFEGIEHCALRDWAGDFELDVALDLCQISQVRWK